MNTHLRPLLWSVTFIFFLAGCRTPAPLSALLGSPDVAIIHGPVSQMKEAGTLVEFAVLATPTNLVSYQWQFNGTNISGATNRELTIFPLAVSHVGAYRVIVSAGMTNQTSSNAYLSVFTLYTTNSNGGTLTFPTGLLAPDSYVCGGVSFSRGHTPLYGTLPALFYGSRAASQIGPFVNSSMSRMVTLDTVHANNAGVTTGIRLRQNWLPSTVLGCKATPLGSPGAVLGPLPLSSDPLTKNTYRATFFYQGTPPAYGAVSFNWLYHN